MKNYLSKKEQRKLQKRTRTVRGYILGPIALILLLVVIIANISGTFQYKEEYNKIWCLGPFLLLCIFCVFALIVNIIYRLHFDNLKVYQYGIVLPYKKSFPPKETYIPFKDVLTVYENPGYPFIVIVRRNNPPEIVQKGDIVCHSTFIRAINGKVKTIYINRLHFKEARKKYKDGTLRLQVEKDLINKLDPSKNVDIIHFDE